MQSRTGICLLDSRLQIESSRIVGTKDIRLEDLRLFTHRGALCGSYTHTDGPIRMRICRFNADLSIEREVEFKFTPERYEKNWQFFDYHGRLLCIYSINPHRIYECDWDGAFALIHSTPFPNDWEVDGKQLRGGTPPALYNGRYYSAFHTSNYYMGMYSFSAEPPFQVIGISNKPFLGHSGTSVHFPCGLLCLEDSFLVTYGEDDKRAKALHLRLLNRGAL
jgi:hypothetical protein